MKTTSNENSLTSIVINEISNVSSKNNNHVSNSKDLHIETIEMYWGEDYLINAYEVIKTSPIYEEF